MYIWNSPRVFFWNVRGNVFETTCFILVGPKTKRVYIALPAQGKRRFLPAIVAHVGRYTGTASIAKTVYLSSDRWTAIPLCSHHDNREKTRFKGSRTRVDRMTIEPVQLFEKTCVGKSAEKLRQLKLSFWRKCVFCDFLKSWISRLVHAPGQRWMSPGRPAYRVGNPIH